MNQSVQENFDSYCKILYTDWISWKKHCSVFFDPKDCKEFAHCFFLKTEATQVRQQNLYFILFRHSKESKAPVSQLVNADDTSVIEIKTQLYLES